jgi:hypothetical protein
MTFCIAIYESYLSTHLPIDFYSKQHFSQLHWTYVQRTMHVLTICTHTTVYMKLNIYVRENSLILSYLILSYLILSYLILSYHNLLTKIHPNNLQCYISSFLIWRRHYSTITDSRAVYSSKTTFHTYYSHSIPREKLTIK